ncbi:hypothetical protein C8R45DRAFT_980002 [Mycena sanguinolenta]|nr:hypothetical protein C8R45DRAFT_980002 [Mycena sanguinolenta]
MSKRNAGNELHTETPKKRPRLMGPADGFSKSSTKPASKSATPKFESAFDTPPAPIKQSLKISRPEKGPKFVDSDARTVVASAGPKPVFRALKPPVPLFNSESKPSATLPVPAPPQPIFPPPVSKGAALRQLSVPAPVMPPSKLLKPLVPPPPPAPSGSVASSSTLKPLVPPPAPASNAPPSDRNLRTISTTLIARATDLFTDNGASELASILLHDQHPDIEFPSTDDVEERRGIMMSPEKSGKGKEKFIRNGLAARAAALFDRSHASISLWEAEMSHSLALSASSSSRRGLNPNMRLRILHILHVPTPVSHPSSKLFIPGVAVCQLLSAPLEPLGSLHPKSKDGICTVLFSFSSLAPPPHPQAPAQLDIRNPEDFAEGREVCVWKPWRVVTIDTVSIKLCVATDTDLDPEREADAEVFDLFEPGTTRSQCRDHVSETALVCERFVILK